MEIYSIGFTKKSAEEFFDLLGRSAIKRLIDVRLKNSSQLAGFSKNPDLAFFLRSITDAEYIHEPLLAPTQEILDSFKKRKGDWADYERDFIALMASRRIEEQLSPALFDKPTVLLCSEPTVEHCHRRLILDYLNEKWGNITSIHL